ncbi:glutamate racemase [Candidatus Chlorohelix sp.]|uniref:glutamate racemase n=1 Tax=Candidatus Chlorohelix sp. TaxID=3139201 RepID=UPI0030212A12
MAEAHDPIGILDSGVGGLSVLREIRKLLPYEDFLYYADSANCPYGIRSPEEIRKLTQRVATILLERGAKALVIACNTASTHSVAYLRQLWLQIPIVGMVPAVKPAAGYTRNGVVGVLATEATSRAPALQDVIERFAGDKKVLISAPPGLVELVESGNTESAETCAILKTHLDPLVAQGVDALVLGCTHFPFLRPLIESIYGDKLLVIDSGEAVARQTCRILENNGLLNLKATSGTLTIFTSGNSQQVGVITQKLLKMDSVPAVKFIIKS